MAILRGLQRDVRVSTSRIVHTAQDGMSRRSARGGALTTSSRIILLCPVGVNSSLTSGSGPDHVRIALKWEFPDTWPSGSKLQTDSPPSGRFLAAVRLFTWGRS